MMQSGVEIDLPSADAESLGADGKQGALVISLDKQGIITLEDGSDKYAEINETELTGYIAEKIGKKGGRLVNIRADSNISYKQIMQVMVAAQKAGAKKIGLMAEPQIIENRQ